MEAVCYLDRTKSVCPVKEYISSLGSQSGMTEVKRRKIVALLRSKVDALVDLGGGPCPPLSKSLHGFSFFEISLSKGGNVLIRVNYFCCNGMMVLLNAYEKPDNYQKNNKKVNRVIDKALIKAELFKNKFVIDNTLYEKFN